MKNHIGNIFDLIFPDLHEVNVEISYDLIVKCDMFHVFMAINNKVPYFHNLESTEYVYNYKKANFV